MAANFLNTNRNADRFFFATTENGEQDLGLSFGTTGGVPNLSTMSVTLSGGGGGVIVNQAPQFVASEFIAGEQALIAGTDSTYFTMSSLTSSILGVNISSDRQGGTGTTCIETYAGNGSLGGFEFLNRGLGSALTSTTNVGINTYLSSINRPGATAVLGSTGTFLTAQYQGSGFTSVDVPTTGGGRTCFNITDLSGATNAIRWAMGTSVAPTGSNLGSDFTLYSYGDAGSFLGSPLKVKRSNGACAIENISSMNTFTGTSSIAVFPTSKTNLEFQAGLSNTAPINGSSYTVLFSTPLTGLNPNGKTFLSINWANALSTGSNFVNYKVGFSTATAFTNTLMTSPVPGLGASFTPSDQPSATTPIGNTLVTAAVDPDGVNADGTGNLYVAAALVDPNSAGDLLYLDKGIVTEASRYAIAWHAM